VIVRKNQPLKQPRAETPTHFMTMGLHQDLDEAARIATREMLDWIVEIKKMNRDDAYLLSSAVMDLVVTQIVDGTKGVHALMPKAIFKK
jgi:acetamidase/formamidase